jgi:integrase
MAQSPSQLQIVVFRCEDSTWNDEDLMGHSDISTTMDVYGHTLTPELHSANALVARKLFDR